MMSQIQWPNKHILDCTLHLTCAPMQEPILQAVKGNMRHKKDFLLQDMQDALDRQTGLEQAARLSPAAESPLQGIAFSFLTAILTFAVVSGGPATLQPAAPLHKLRAQQLPLVLQIFSALRRLILLMPCT